MEVSGECSRSVVGGLWRMLQEECRWRSLENTPGV